MSLGIYISIVLAMVGSITGAVYKIIEGKGKPVRIVSIVVIILCVLDAHHSFIYTFSACNTRMDMRTMSFVHKFCGIDAIKRM